VVLCVYEAFGWISGVVRIGGRRGSTCRFCVCGDFERKRGGAAGID
jgi:hypothetical protein